MDNKRLMDREKRKFWMQIFSCSDYKNLKSLFDESDLEKPKYKYLRKPETGLYMTRARADANGEQFNLGEVLVSRCALILDDVFGVSYIRGGDLEHCEFAALLDAMLQKEEHFEKTWENIVVPAFEILKNNREKEAEKINKTRVEFFTMG